MSERKQDIVVGLLAAAGCVAFLRGARGFQPPLVADPLGPSAFPTILGWAGLILAAAQIVFAWAQHAPPEGSRASLRRYFVPLALFGLLLAYSLTLDSVGYIPTTLLFVLFSFLLLRVPIWRAGLIAAAFSVGFYLLFTKVLKVTLPAGFVFRGW
jgi:putative tricarboxylic transport membrane protein